MSAIPPSIGFQPIPSTPPAGNVNVGVVEKKLITIDTNENIVQFIDSKIPPGATVEYCQGTVEREKPDDFSSPPVLSTFYNPDVKKHCYKMNLIYEIKIKAADGKEEILQIKQERGSTLAVPRIKFSNREADRAHQAFAIGSEYAKTISAVFDSSDPKYEAMQSEKVHLLKDDSIQVKLISFDTAEIFRGYNISLVSWKDSGDLANKKIKVIRRNLRHEVFKIDQAADRILRKSLTEKVDNKTIFDGVDLIRRDTKITVNSAWFDTLKEIEKLNKKDIVDKLEEHKIDEKEYIQRLSRKSKDTFYDSLARFGEGAYKVKQLPLVLAQIQQMQNNPNKSMDEKSYLLEMRSDFGKIDAAIQDLETYKGQLEVLLEKHPKMEALWAFPGGTGKDSLFPRWTSKTVQEKIDYLNELKIALSPAFT
jgi:hypothetical protein